MDRDLKRKDEKEPYKDKTPEKVPRISHSQADLGDQASLRLFWKSIDTTVEKIYGMKRLSREDYMKLTTNVYNFCVTGFHSFSPIVHNFVRGRSSEGSIYTAKLIYDQVRALIVRHLGTIAADLPDISTEQEAVILGFYVEQWERFIFSTRVLNGVFSYINRHYVAPHNSSVSAGPNSPVSDKLYEVFQLGLIEWRRGMFRALKSVVTNAVLKLIKKDRAGELVPNDQVQLVIQSLIEMGVNPTNTVDTERDMHGNVISYITPHADLSVYQREFEDKLISDTAAFYRDEAAGFIHKNGPLAYIEMAGKYLEVELIRSQKWFHYSSKAKVMNACKKILVEEHLDTIYGEFRPLLEGEKGPKQEERLKQLYFLIFQLQNKKIMAEMVRLFGTNVCSIGRLEMKKRFEEIQDRKNGPLVFVDIILKHFNESKRIVKEVFAGETAFLTVLYTGFRDLLRENVVTEGDRKNRTKSAEYMARYCDAILKNKLVSDELAEDTFSRIAELFNLLEDRDVFVRYTSQLLALRLTERKSSSDEAERVFIERVTVGRDCEHMKVLSRMFQDCNISKELTTEFNALMAYRDRTFGYEFSVQILSSGSWPYFPDGEFTMPDQLQASLAAFSKFYSSSKDAPESEVEEPSKHTGRKLTWLPGRSYGEIRYFPPDSPTPNFFTFTVSAYQMAILLLFETADSMVLDEIVAAIRVKLPLVQQIIKVFLQCKLLTTPGNKDELTGASRVYLFKGYKNKKTRLNINVPMKAESTQQDEKINEEIQRNRAFQVQARIVRLMKTQKTCPYNELVRRIIEQFTSASNSVSSFKPTVRLIHSSIEILIERDYLKRNDADQTNLIYVA